MSTTKSRLDVSALSLKEAKTINSSITASQIRQTIRQPALSAASSAAAETSKTNLVEADVSVSFVNVPTVSMMFIENSPAISWVEYLDKNSSVLSWTPYLLTQVVKNEEQQKPIEQAEPEKQAEQAKQEEKSEQTAEQTKEEGKEAPKTIYYEYEDDEPIIFCLDNLTASLFQVQKSASTVLSAADAANVGCVSDTPAAAIVAAPAELPLPALPPVNASCYAPPAVAPGVNTAQQVQLPTELRNIETNDADLQTIVRENSNSTTYNKTIVTTVNRNHLHTQRIVDNQNQYNTYITNKIVKVNDIHRQRIENVAGERRVLNSYQQSQQVEPARCLRTDSNL